MSLVSLASCQSLTSQGWAQSPVTDEDRRRLVGSFVTSEGEASDVSLVRPVLTTDPVLGEVIRHIEDGEPRPVRQQPEEAGQDQSDEGSVLQGFFVDQQPPSEDNFSTNFEDEPEDEASEDLEQLIEYQYQYDYQEQDDDQVAQEQTLHHAAHQHQQHSQQPQFRPPQHIGIGRDRDRRSKISIVP